MATPTYVSLTQSTVTINWTALSSNADIGGTPITSYNLYWDNGSGTTSISLEDSLVLTKPVTGLSGGTAYKFKVRAKNVNGYGPFSSELTITASSTPDTMSMVSVTRETTNIKFTWSAPDDGDSSITDYTVLLYQPDTNSYGEDTSLCDATTA